MRDINRIDPFLKELGELWKQNPDMRFGQLIMNLETGSPSVIWNLEEEDWLERIQDKKKSGWN